MISKNKTRKKPFPVEPILDLPHTPRLPCMSEFCARITNVAFKFFDHKVLLLLPPCVHEDLGLCGKLSRRYRIELDGEGRNLESWMLEMNVALLSIAPHWCVGFFCFHCPGPGHCRCVIVTVAVRGCGGSVLATCILYVWPEVVRDQIIDVNNGDKMTR